MAKKEIKVQGLTLYVTDEHSYHKGGFIFHCSELNVSEKVLKKATSIEEAVELAVKAIEVHLQNKMAALTRLQIQVLEERNIDQLIAELQRVKEEGVSGETIVRVGIPEGATEFDSYELEQLFYASNLQLIGLLKCN